MYQLVFAVVQTILKLSSQLYSSSVWTGLDWMVFLMVISAGLVHMLVINHHADKGLVDLRWLIGTACLSSPCVSSTRRPAWHRIPWVRVQLQNLLRPRFRTCMILLLLPLIKQGTRSVQIQGAELQELWPFIIDHNLQSLTCFYIYAPAYHIIKSCCHINFL